MATVLVVDAERGIRNSLKERLEYEGYRVVTAQSKQEATDELERSLRFDVVLCDLSLLDNGFVELQSAVQAGRPPVPLIVLSKEKSDSSAVDCIRRGAYDYIEKPIDLNRLLASIRASLHVQDQNRATLNAEPLQTSANASGESVRGVSAKISSLRERAPVMIGSSKGMMHIRSLIDKIAPTDARVLILGANGTGKEVAAHVLHTSSRRAAGPFVELNCAAMPSELIESELFGHEKGAFTSAIKMRRGKFEQADGGTLFLDEIGDMSLSAQAKVLRALQENRVCRVGSDRDIEVNVRVVAATNKNLHQEILAGHFREDLYHRLSVIVIRLPSLRERADDIPELTNYFIDRICEGYRINPKPIDPEAIRELTQMEWPGNVRELHNVVERLIVLSAETITLEDVQTYAVGMFE